MARPKKPDADAKRATIATRVTLSLRAQIEEAAADSGRSLAQEIELRLEQSFRHDDLRAIVREEVAAGLQYADPVTRYHAGMQQMQAIEAAMQTRIIRDSSEWPAPGVYEHDGIRMNVTTGEKNFDVSAAFAPREKLD